MLRWAEEEEEEEEEEEVLAPALDEPRPYRVTHRDDLGDQLARSQRAPHVVLPRTHRESPLPFPVYFSLYNELLSSQWSYHCLFYIREYSERKEDEKKKTLRSQKQNQRATACAPPACELTSEHACGR